MSAGDFTGGFVGGYAKGMLAKQEQAQSQQKDAMDVLQFVANQQNKNRDYEIAREQLGIQQQELYMKKHAYNEQFLEAQRQKEIDKGLGTALSTGGYGAAIDYLKQEDPRKAIEFHAAKLALDKQIMENEVLQTTAPVEKQKAMYESYGLMGKLGAGIERLGTPEDKARAWKIALPMIQKIWPSAPDQYNADAQVAMKLAMAQGTPENIIYDTSKNELMAKTQIGKNGADIAARIKAGHTPETDPTLRALLADQKGLEAKAQSNSLQLLETQMSMAKTQQQATESFNKTLESSSGDFMKALDSYSQVKAHIEGLKADPTNPYKQSVIQRMFIKSVNSGAMSLADEALGEAATGVPGLQKKLASMVTGQQVRLNTQETQALSSAWETSMQGKLDRQLAIEAKYKDSGKNYPNIQWNAVRFPSQDYYRFVDRYSTANTNAQVISKLPKEVQAQAQDALEKAGNDQVKREQVMKKIQGFLQQSSIPAVQQTATPSQPSDTGEPVSGQ